MTVVQGLPSPWGEAAKGIFHLKNIPWAGVYLNAGDQDMTNWFGSNSAPAVVYDNERPRSSWIDILLLAERLSPALALLPKNTEQRAQAMGLCHEICGEHGLGWTRRLELVDRCINGKGGFPESISKYLGGKYGYQEQEAGDYEARVISILNMLTDCLRGQLKAGKPFYIGESISAVDIYSATFMALFKPLPPKQCPMIKSIRPVFETMSDDVEKALDPILIAHRDLMYSEYLALPLSL
jgi:glutathione S-transferase